MLLRPNATKSSHVYQERDVIPVRFFDSFTVPRPLVLTKSHFYSIQNVRFSIFYYLSLMFFIVFITIGCSFYPSVRDNSVFGKSQIVQDICSASSQLSSSTFKLVINRQTNESPSNIITNVLSTQL